MNTWDLILIAIGLSMDAFAVSICKGLSVQKPTIKNNIIVGLYFGGFQGLMPLIGYLIAAQFSSFITGIGNWISFVLLAFIGGKMIKESTEGVESVDSSFSFRSMFPLAIATSIDALAVGITFAFLSVEIAPAVGLIGITTLVLSLVGVAVGHRFGARYEKPTTIAGGVVLILIGLKILLEHLDIISF